MSDELNEDFEECEILDEPGCPCHKPASRIVEEPWTPGRFKIRVCDEHAYYQVHYNGFLDRGVI